MYTLAGFLGPIGTPELIILLIFGLLIFGKRLPEVGKSLGKGIVEFRKGLKGIEREIETETERPVAARLPERDKVGAPLTPSGEDARVSRPFAEPQKVDRVGPDVGTA